jgi:hypothetical protein
MLICVLATAAVAGIAPNAASAADLGPYEESETVIERPAPIVEHERIIERRYYEPDYYDGGPVVTYYRPRYAYPYVAGYPYRWGPRFHHRYWRHYGRW